MTAEERKAYAKAWRAKNPNYQREWKAKHPDYHRKWREQYRITNTVNNPTTNKGTTQCQTNHDPSSRTSTANPN